jgi:hypothetical protein
LTGARARQLCCKRDKQEDTQVNRISRIVPAAAIALLLTGVCLAWVIAEGRMTGGGSFFQGDLRVTHGFELHCDVTRQPNNLEVNWGPGNRFHLDTLTSAVCLDTGINPAPPKAPFDTYIGAGTGSYNGVAGATATWTFTDAGEPGTSDLAQITVTDAGGNIVLSAGPSFLRFGNHQAHAENP